LFDEGKSPADNLGQAILEAVQSGTLTAAYQEGEIWIVVTPHGTGGALHLAGALSSQLEDL
jgi:hypothetical protein